MIQRKSKHQSTTTQSNLYSNERELQIQLANLEIGLDSPFTITFLRREVPVGNRIPDLIYVRFLTLPDSTLWPRKWSFRHAHMLWLLRSHQFLTPEIVASLSYESVERITPTLDDLIRSGAVDTLPNGTLALTSKMVSIKAEIIAAEAKLRAWRAALAQANVYLRFANRVFVAMDPQFAPKDAMALDAFRQQGIGLCTVTRKTVEWLVMPTIQPGWPGPDSEYLIASAATPSRQHLWSRRNARNASRHA